MPYKLHKDFGPVNERIFPASRLDEHLRGWLETFKGKKIIHDYRLDGGTLTLWRPWLESQSLEEFFGDLPQGERKYYSGELFRRQARRLREGGAGHGALHPRNILLQPGKFEPVDALFNSVLMNPRTVQDQVWLWGPCLPKEWSLEDWDRVSLLRTAALLSEVPSSWTNPLSPQEASQVCRQWSEDLKKIYGAGADFLVEVKEALALLPRIITAVFELPSFPLEEELERLRQEAGPLRVLREVEEEEIRTLAADHGSASESLDERFEIWMLRNHFRRERELGELAEEFLKAGLWRESENLVTARACAAAERVYSFYGISSPDAMEAVQAILTAKGWMDERQAALRCQKHLAKRFPEAGEIPEPALTQEFVAGFGEEGGYGPAVSQRLVELEVERRLLGLAH